MSVQTDAALAFDLFRSFAAKNRLGIPDKILGYEPDVPELGIFGVGAQWGEGEEAIRTAYRVPSQEAADELEKLMTEYDGRSRS